MERSALRIQKSFNLLSLQIRGTFASSKSEFSGRMDTDLLHRSILNYSIIKRIYIAYINRVTCSRHRMLAAGNKSQQQLKRSV